MVRAIRATVLPIFFALAASCGSQEGADVVEGKSCPEIVENGGDEIPAPPDGASLCPAGACNYQTQEGCPDDMGCQPALSANGLSVEPTCSPAGERTAGEACNDALPCLRGYECALGYCRKLCCGRD